MRFTAVCRPPPNRKKIPGHSAVAHNVSSLPIKQRLLVAAGHVIASDGTVTVEEGELYRALTATLGCPMPNLGIAN